MVPRIATPIVAPTWRTAEISADPEPLRSPVSGRTAASIADGIATPRPAPVTAIHSAAKAVADPSPVKAPIARPMAITANPAALAVFALTRAVTADPAGLLRGADSLPPAAMPN